MRRASLALLLVAAALMPLYATTYALHVAMVVLINVVYTAAVYSVMRMGYLSFGHAGFVAVGAYTTVILSTKLGLSPWLGIVCGGLVAAAVGWAIGVLTLRLRGIYFSLSVFAFGEIVNGVFRAFDYFGGPNGLAGVPRPEFFGIALATHQTFYYLVLVVAVGSLAFLYLLQYTRFGFTLLAFRTPDSEKLAQSVGINAPRYKNAAFVVSCCVAGLMGAVHAHYLNFVSPSIFTFIYSTDLVIYAMVGGLGNFAGPLLGAAALTALGEQLFSVGYYKTLVYAVILMMVILALPGGLIQLPATIKRLLSGRRVESMATR